MNSESSERRKGRRRSGVGRRIAGDRRKEERAILPGWAPRQAPRRLQKRRSLSDRRSRDRD